MSEAKPCVLVVDDEPDIRELLEMTLRRMQLDCVTVEDLAQARSSLASRHFNLCLTDMRLPDGNGIELVELIQQQYPQLPVAMITAHGNMSSAIEALKAGAFDFVTKPVELQVLRELVNSALRLSAPLSSGKGGEGQRETLQLLGNSPHLQEIRSLISKLARSQAPVYISGESGTGKELVARLIHAQGPRAEQPFIPVNCGAIPSELMESELFGHKKGSFTGAHVDKQGLFQAANGGTLFLDEVADLPLQMQVKLLRAIQEKAIRPVGAQQEQHIDVRILSATHKDLAGLVARGHFREDLYYRINVIELKVPSLRESPSDIPLFVDSLLKRLARQLQIEPPSFSQEAMSALERYPFPGNVRELENILERATTLCEDNRITVADLRLPDHTLAETEQPSTARPCTASGLDPEEIGLESYLENMEKEVLLNALEKTRHNKTAAAKLLGLTFRALRYRLKKLDLE